MGHAARTQAARRPPPPRVQGTSRTFFSSLLSSFLSSSLFSPLSFLLSLFARHPRRLCRCRCHLHSKQLLHPPLLLSRAVPCPALACVPLPLPRPLFLCCITQPKLGAQLVTRLVLSTRLLCLRLQSTPLELGASHVHSNSTAHSLSPTLRFSPHLSSIRFDSIRTNPTHVRFIGRHSPHHSTRRVSLIHSAIQSLL